MGSFRDYVDVAGGLRSGLNDDPPWWARGAIAVFAGVVVVVIGLSAVLGVGGAVPTARVDPAPDTAGAPSPAAPAAPAAPGHAGATGPWGGDAAADDGETVALADRLGTFRHVPRAAVAAARERGAIALGVPIDEVRHQLVSLAPGRVELTISVLDGRRDVRVVATERDGAWQAA